MIYIINFGSNKTRHISERLAILEYESQIIDWNEAETIDWKKARGIILSGAPVLITETDIEPYLKRYAFLKNSKVPVLGICFGHQLLGILFGAEIFLGSEVRTETKISILIKNELFTGFEEKTIMEEDHTEGITLPPAFIKLASSGKYDVEAMKHYTLPIFGVQFHPEISGENGLRLLTNFCKLT